MKAFNCSQCGALVKQISSPDKFAFCDYCGAKILMQEDKVKTAPRLFLADYNQGKKESLFDTWIMSVEDDDWDEDTKKWVKIIGIILAIALIVFLPFVLVKEFKAKSEMSENQRKTSATPPPSPKSFPR